MLATRGRNCCSWPTFRWSTFLCRCRSCRKRPPPLFAVGEATAIYLSSLDCLQGWLQSTWSPFALIGSAHLAISSTTNLARYSGDLRSSATPVTPISCIRLLIAGVSMARLVASLKIGRATSELQSLRHLVCRLLL